MCSIAGFYCYGKARPDIETLKGIMLAAESRGTSAAGMAYMTAKKQIMIRKSKGPAHDLSNAMTTAEWQEVAASPRALFHARATTKGTENNNENNHPVSYEGWVVVHNGHLTNDDELFEYYKTERYAAVDTAAIPLVLSKGKTYEDSLRQLSVIGGQATVAIWALDYPDKIAIARLGSNDVYFFLDPERRIMYWCSTPLAGRYIPGYRIKNLGFFTVSKLHENKLVILEPGLDSMRLLKIERRPFVVSRWVATPVGRSSGDTESGPTTPKTEANHPLDRIGLVTKRESVTKGKVRRGFNWGQPNPQQKAKPDIDIAGVQPDWFDWGAIRQKFSDWHTAHGGHMVYTYETTYGRWLFDCPDTERPAIFHTTFIPARRIKKYWRRHFNDDIPGLRLPAEIGKLDGKMTLEEFAFIETVPARSPDPPTKIHIMGYMCPWCGVTDKTQAWSKLDFRCQCCGIVSKPFGA